MHGEHLQWGMSPAVTAQSPYLLFWIVFDMAAHESSTVILSNLSGQMSPCMLEKLVNYYKLVLHLTLVFFSIEYQLVLAIVT